MKNCTIIRVVKIKPIKNNLRKKKKKSTDMTKKSSEDMNQNSVLLAPWKDWFLKIPSRLDKVLREYSKNDVDNAVENFILKKPYQMLNL